MQKDKKPRDRQREESVEGAEGEGDEKLTQKINSTSAIQEGHLCRVRGQDNNGEDNMNETREKMELGEGLVLRRGYKFEVQVHEAEQGANLSRRTTM